MSVPKGWRECKIGIGAKILCGFAFKSESFAREGIPIIRISNIEDDNSVSINRAVYYKNMGDNFKFTVNNGDILIAMSGATTGKIGVYRNKKSAYLNQRVGKFITTVPIINSIMTAV